jgi:5-methylcytosine-specific restriction endonuclease McrA
MTSLHALIAAHPLPKEPYNAIKFARFDGHGTALYTVGKDSKEVGAAAALKTAFEQWGGHCFHCKVWMPPQKLSQECTRDHLRPRASGGKDLLHNLVFACGPCNRAKGGGDLIAFQREAGMEYLTALEAHLTRCLQALGTSR